jgi:peroxidase
MPRKMQMKVSILLFFFALPLVLAQLQDGFYKSTCPTAESVVQEVVQDEFSRDRSLPAALLRMHFHDCFVRVSYILCTQRPLSIVTLILC